MLSFTSVAQPIVQGYTHKKKASVRRAEFEGGYSQRSGAGPNSVVASVRLQWLQPNADIDTIDAFLTARGGAQAFLYRLPNDAVDRIWTCGEWSVVPKGPHAKQLDATFRQEFDIF
jgi:phage-related protein